MVFRWARFLFSGDVLVVEKPAFAFLLETEHNDKGNKEALWTHCSECYKMSLGLEPCSECKWVSNYCVPNLVKYENKIMSFR